jgi:hypothetical protein
MRAFPDRVAFASFSTELGEVNICLYAYKRRSQYNKQLITETTHPNENLILEKPTPGVIRIVLLVRVYQHWPLIARDCQFAAGKFLSYSASESQQRRNLAVSGTYSGSPQSTPAGQRRAPVALWWNPRFVLTLRERGGFSGTSRGVIQSSTAPFILLVSSDLALETPF